MAEEESSIKRAQQLPPPPPINHTNMPTFYFLNQGHTIASAIRPELEAACDREQLFVACTVMHPLDEHIVVEAPSKDVVKEALMKVKEHIRTAIISL
jgi:UV DNA damage repair endonuclease